MSDRAANSSDLTRARSLSQRLANPDRVQRLKADPTAVSFSRFRAEEGFSRDGRPTVNAAHDVPQDFSTWDDLLAWIEVLTPSQTSFVVDPEGFVIARHGDRSLEELEGIGAQFQEIADRATEIEVGAARALALHLDTFWLSGLRFSQEGSGYFLIGIIADEALSKEVQAAISVQVGHNLERL